MAGEYTTFRVSPRDDPVRVTSRVLMLTRKPADMAHRLELLCRRRVSCGAAERHHPRNASFLSVGYGASREGLPIIDGRA
jgi:hypothetical protein